MLRLILIFLIVFLIVRAFIITGMQSREEKPEQPSGETPKKSKKGVPKEIGEYVEYEEVEGKV
jgi:hypothetical protein